MGLYDRDYMHQRRTDRKKKAPDHCTSGKSEVHVTKKRNESPQRSPPLPKHTPKKTPMKLALTLIALMGAAISVYAFVPATFILTALSALGLIVIWRFRKPAWTRLTSFCEDWAEAYRMSRYYSFERKKGNEVGLCSKLTVNVPCSRRGKEKVLVAQIVLSISGQFHPYLDIIKRLKSFDIDVDKLYDVDLNTILGVYGIQSEHRAPPHDDMHVFIWNSLDQGRIIVLPVNVYRLENPHDSLFVGGEMDGTIVITGMKVGYSGEVAICYTHIFADDSHVRFVEAQYIKSFASNRFLEIHV